MEDLKGAWYPTNVNKSKDNKEKSNQTTERSDLLTKRLNIDLIKNEGGNDNAGRQ